MVIGAQNRLGIDDRYDWVGMVKKSMKQIFADIMFGKREDPLSS
jgi:hypothetical protein